MGKAININILLLNIYHTVHFSRNYFRADTTPFSIYRTVGNYKKRKYSGGKNTPGNYIPESGVWKKGIDCVATGSNC